MKHVAKVALMLNLGLAGIYAQPTPVSLTVSGTAANSTISLQPNTPASEYQLAGDGTLGPFTLRLVSASAASPGSSITCQSPKLYFPVVAGAGVFRFQDGSLLTANLTGGSDCIDLVANQALCTRIFQITGGTGGLQGASGNVLLTMTVVPVLADASSNPVFFAETGNITGTISAVPRQNRQ